MVTAWRHFWKRRHFDRRRKVAPSDSRLRLVFWAWALASDQPCSTLRRRQPAIELIGERLPVFGAEVGRSSSDLASPAQLIQEIPHG
jgi:hypothetical protein